MGVRTLVGTGASSLVAVQRDSECLSAVQDDTLVLKALSLLWLVVSGLAQSVRSILVYSVPPPVACMLTLLVCFSPRDPLHPDRRLLLTYQPLKHIHSVLFWTCGLFAAKCQGQPLRLSA